MSVCRSVCWLVGWPVGRCVGRSVIISVKGGKLHIHAPMIELVIIYSGIYILAILSKLKIWEEFEGVLEKRKGKGGKRRKRKRVIKQTYLYEA